MSENYWRNRVEQWTGLNPVDRISEVLYGLIIFLTFIGSFIVSSGGTQDINALLWTALGCNFAWALVDAIMNLMNNLLERGHDFMKLRKIITSIISDDARREAREDIHPFIELMDDQQIDKLVEKLKKLPELPKKNTLTWKDFLISFEIFLLVFICTLPVAIPFFLFDEVYLAMRISNVVTLIMLFIGGYIIARYAGFKPVITAAAYTAIGVLLMVIIMVLGG